MSREPEYLAVSLEGMTKLAKIGKTEKGILFVMMKHCQNDKEFDGCIVEVTPRVRREIMVVTGLKTKQSMYNSVARIVKAELIERVDHNLYLLNPRVFLRKGGHR